MADRDKTAGGAETTIEAASKASGRRSQIIHEADAEEPDEVIAAQADKAVELVDLEVVTEPFIENLEDPEVAKSRKSIINSIIELRAKKPNYTCG